MGTKVELEQKWEDKKEEIKHKIKKAVRKWKDEMTPKQKEDLEKVKGAYEDVKNWYSDKVTNSKWAKRAREDIESAREKIKTRNNTFKTKVNGWLSENGFDEFASASMIATAGAS